MKSYEEKFPELYQYLAGLFHQDWKDVFDWKEQKYSFEAVVRYFKVRSSQNYRQQELRELKEFLNLGLETDDVTRIIKTEWGIAFRPAYINLTHKQWLERILEILEEPMEETKKHFIPEFVG